MRATLLFGLVAALIAGTWATEGASSALTILNYGIISAIMALGVNLQWGFAGLFNVGVMGFTALGGLAVVLISAAPDREAWAAGGGGVLLGLLLGAATIVAAITAGARLRGRARVWIVAAILLGGFVLYRAIFDAGAAAIEAVNPATSGYLGGLGLPVLLAWPAGGLLAAGVAWIVGKTALGLRSDYLAIATLGIAEIVIAVMKNEDWLARGVKNVAGLPRPLPREVDLQADPLFVARAEEFGLQAVEASSLVVKLGYAGLCGAVLIALLVAAQLALRSPWGRMMRMIRDNEVSARAMGKDVTRQHLQVFILGSAICGIAGAMMVTMDGLLNPSGYQPLRFTFLIWVMVIVGGSGNNFGAVLGGFLIWFLWVQVDPWSATLTEWIGAGLPEGALRERIEESAAFFKLPVMGALMLLTLRFAPRGLIPER
ncbi:MAG: branched-chain amino acid ABC transporter permease [Paracoccaceae bacterium]